jgi:hypothetical protein
MSTVDEIVKAVQELSPQELQAFRVWFVEFDQALWDKELERDITAGRLDELAEEALDDLSKGRCSDL